MVSQKDCSDSLPAAGHAARADLLPPGCDPGPWLQSIVGVNFHALDWAGTLDLIERRLDEQLSTQHVVINVAKVVGMRRDPKLRAAVESCDLINVDGMGVLWAARLLGMPVKERVAGVDLFFALLELASRRGERVFLLGGTAEVIQETARVLQARFPALQVAGFHHGYFWGREEEVVDMIRQSKATMLFVAISSPMKEKFLSDHHQELNLLFSMGVGGTFDIVAGVARRAPVWMQKMGMEWLYRVIQEPKRARRVLTTNFVFLGLVLREWVFRSPSRQ